MKRAIFVITIILSSFSIASAQSETKSFDVDGIKVIFKPTVKDIINVRIYYRGGTSNYTPNKAGIEDLALDAATKCGTKKYSAQAMRDSSDKYDILMYGSSTYDYGYVQMNCIPQYFDRAWELFAETIMNPIFEPAEVELLKNKKISDIKGGLSDPYANLREFQMANAFANTSYAISPKGHEETLDKLTSGDLSNYYPALLNKNKLFIVVVGKVSKDKLVEKIIAAFGNITSQPYSRPDYSPPVWNNSKLTAEQRDFATNYISAIMNSPGMTNVDYVPFQLGVSGLSGNINAALRRQRGLSYSQGAYTVKLIMPYAEMYVSTTRPLDAMQAMMEKLKGIQNFEMNDEWLNRIKNSYLIASYIDNQSASDITSRLGEAEVLGGWQYAEDLPQLVKMVTSDQVNRALQFYIVGLKWYYLGNSDAVDQYKVPKY